MPLFLHAKSRFSHDSACLMELEWVWVKGKHIEEFFFYSKASKEISTNQSCYTLYTEALINIMLWQKSYEKRAE